MTKIMKRIMAYLIDLILITMLAQGLSSTTILNPNLNKYQKYSKEYNELYSDYANFALRIQKYYQDKNLTEEEYNKLIEKYPSYEEKINKYYKDSKLTEKNYKKLVTEITKEYSTKANKIYYKIEKNSIADLSIYIILVILYFVGFNVATNGQTLGKKLMRLKIVNNEDEKKKVTALNYLIRTILMYELSYYIVRLVGINILNNKTYMTVTSYTYYLQTILDFAIMVTILARKDQRGLHDILSKTRVAMYDRNGIEIKKEK